MNTTVAAQGCALCHRTNAARYAPGPRVAICGDCAKLPATDVRSDAKRCAFCWRRTETGLERGDVVICASCLEFARELTASNYVHKECW